MRFTDDPAKANDPNWNYLPDRPGYRQAPPASGPAAPPAGGGMNFDRKEFEKILEGKMGGNPHLSNPVAEVDKIYQDELPKAFQHVFKRAFRPWEALPPQEQKYWDQQQKVLKANIQEQLGAAHKQKINQWDWALKQFEEEAKMAGARMTPGAKAKIEKESRLLDIQTTTAKTDLAKAQKPPEWLQKAMVVKNYPELARKLGLDKTGLTRKDTFEILAKLAAGYDQYTHGDDIGAYITKGWEAMTEVENRISGKGAKAEKPYSGEKPPMEGAIRKKDGTWEVTKNGKRFRVMEE